MTLILTTRIDLQHPDNDWGALAYLPENGKAAWQFGATPEQALNALYQHLAELMPDTKISLIDNNGVLLIGEKKTVN